MSKVKMTVKPSQGSKLANAPKDLAIGTKIEALGEPWNYKKGETSRNGKTQDEPNAGQVVKAGTEKFGMRFDKLADDLLKQKGRTEADHKAAGISLNKLDSGEVEITVTFPNSGIGIAGGNYIVAKAAVTEEE